MWSTYVQASNIEEVLSALSIYGSRARIVAGGTDLMLELERGARKGVDVVIDVSRIPDLDYITIDSGGNIHLGPNVTHNDCVASPLIRDRAYPLARACWEVGSPQIRNRGTVAGNVVTASPANDTITPLMALGAVITLRSIRGERRVKIAEFYTGVRRTVMNDDEMVVDISFPPLNYDQSGIFIKFALRRAQAISLVNLAIILTSSDGVIQDARITLGAVAPTIIHAEKAERFLVGKSLTDEEIATTALLAMEAAKPINDVRGSAKYRRTVTKVITRRALLALRDGQERDGFPESPVLLLSKAASPEPGSGAARWEDEESSIETTINGRQYSLKGCYTKSLLRMIREDVGLIGTKEGCAEGECGACTIIMDGKAVMSCLVPAPRAHGSVIRTIEGVMEGESLHPIQQAFVEEGAVQCGYCTPGFIMSATTLLTENPSPTINQIEQALTGNLCRCTGYYKIVRAVEMASKSEVDHGKV